MRRPRHRHLAVFLSAMFFGALAVTAALSGENSSRALPGEPARILTPAVDLQTPADPVTLVRQRELPNFDLKDREPTPELRSYNGRSFRYSKTFRLRVTAYAPDPRCCWPYDGTTTASGLPVTTNHGRLVAADTKLIPMHSLVEVPGYAGGKAVPVLDRGGAIQGYRLDVLLPTYEQAKAWGSRMLEVKVYLTD